MLELYAPQWAELQHAYGSAEGIPEALAAAVNDPGPSDDEDSVWFDLWSALCHQRDVYTASYAAVPHLVLMAEGRRPVERCDPLFLTACIEWARLEGKGPPIPTDLAADYAAAVTQALTLVNLTLPHIEEAKWREALTGAREALSGDAAAARAIFDGPEDDG
jgi:hypothetical protein